VRVALLLLATGLVACSSYSPELGSDPFTCGSADPRCPDGYACISSASGAQICSDGSHAGSGSGSGSNAGTCATPYSGMLATYAFTGQTGTQASTAGTAGTSGITVGPITRSAGLTSATGTGSINSSNWPTAATVDKFYTVTITPPSGCKLAVTGASVELGVSGTGPTTALLATSADNFAANVPLSTTAMATPTLSATSNGGLEIRIIGHSASATTGTMRVQNTLTFSGALQ
jgi:hypothetical protein